jgi:hypothetical protein
MMINEPKLYQSAPTRTSCLAATGIESRFEPGVCYPWGFQKKPRRAKPFASTREVNHA